MRNLKRNTVPVFYRNYLGEEEIIDEYGNATGAFLPVYGELKSAFLTVSPNKGNSEVEQFGSFADYDRTMTTSDTRIDMTEDSVLWMDGADTEKAHNAIVMKRAPWKNSVQFAVKMVKVSYAEANDEENPSDP